MISIRTIYINDITKEQNSFIELQESNPNTSLPMTEVIGGEWFILYGSALPSHDRYTQKTEEVDPIKTDNKYYRAYTIVSLSSEEQERALQSSQSSKISETWKYADNNITLYENGLVQEGIIEKSKRLNQMNDSRTNKRINSDALTPDEDTDQSNYEDYVVFSDDTNTQATITETSILAMTDGNLIDDIVVKDEPFPVVPFSSLTQVERQRLIDELLIQGSVIWGNLMPSDANSLTDFIDNATIVTITGNYGIMPSGRELYNSLGEVVGQDISVMITKHIQGNTYFDPSSDEFRAK